MGINFPSSPTVGQKYPSPSVAGVPTYTWDGQKWTTFADALGPPLYVSKLAAGDTMAGDLTIAKTGPALYLSKAASGQDSIIYGMTNGASRWTLALGDSTAEAAGSVGGDFRIRRYDNAGAYIDSPLVITRADGKVYVNGDPGAPSGVATKQYVDNKPTVDSSKVAKTGDTMSGSLQSTYFYSTGTIRAASAIYCNANGTIVEGSINHGYMAQCFMSRSNAEGFDCSFENLHVFGAWAGVRIMISQSGPMVDFRNDGNIYTPGGGPNVAYSDARIKTVIGEYENGLEQVCALHPVRYIFNGNETDIPPDQPLSGDAPYKTSAHYEAAMIQDEHIGLIAQEAEVPMPETVWQTKGYIDGVVVEDLRTLDTGPILFALVNAVKELKTRVEALEAARV